MALHLAHAKCDHTNLYVVSPVQVLSCDIDLLHPPAELEKQKHKLKRLVESPNSYFMDVKCQGCFNMYVLGKLSKASRVLSCFGCCLVVIMHPTSMLHTCYSSSFFLSQFSLLPMLQYHCVQSFSDCSGVPQLQCDAVCAHRRQGKTPGRMLFQEEG